MFTFKSAGVNSEGISIASDNILRVCEKADINYDIIASEDIFHEENKTIYEYCHGKTLAIYISPKVNSIYGSKIRNYFKKNFAEGSYFITVIPTTELNKNMESVKMVCEFAKKNNIDRKGVMLAIGGGIINDIVGFAASIYKRGIRYIRICTTLVGQVDVAVGIKVGINFLNSKNFLGAFHPPYTAINDKMLLNTLEQEHISCGLAEIIKMGIIWDYHLFELVEQEYYRLLNKDFNSLNANNIIARSILSMVENLCTNLYEHNLERLVDFGHTFSPIIETASNHDIPHGQAVAIDMAISSCIAYLMGLLSEDDFNRIISLLINCNLPVYSREYCTFELMKKAVYDAYLHRGKQLNLPVPNQIGKAQFVKDIELLTDSILKQALAALNKINKENHC